MARHSDPAAAGGSPAQKSRRVGGGSLRLFFRLPLRLTGLRLAWLRLRLGLSRLRLAFLVFVVVGVAWIGHGGNVLPLAGHN